MAENNKKLSFYFATWNVATKYPQEDPRSMLGMKNCSNEPGSYDFVVVGLQEVKSQPQNMVLDIFFEDPWTKSFREALKGKDYVKIRTQRLQGLVLNVFCLRKHLTHLRSIEARYTKTGFGGMWGNKGAVSVRLNIYGVSICIVNTHLTPHDHLLAERIADYNTIVRDHTFNVSENQNIFYHDYIFWIGDLNFRLKDETLTSQEIDLQVKNKQLNTLLEKDQLMNVMKSGEAFAELTEAEITFPPTYKFEFASQNYDFRRRPSWTDRILYKVNADVYEDVKLNATQRSYESHPSYVQSDHKPVTAEFDITTRPEYEIHGIEFQPVTAWFVDEENSVSYKLLGDARTTNGDWIGLFHEGFSSLDDYIVYEYVGRGKMDIDLETTVPADSITGRIYFSETALKTPGMYRLVYVSQGNDGIISILGISPPFPGHRRISELHESSTTII